VVFKFAIDHCTNVIVKDLPIPESEIDRFPGKWGNMVVKMKFISEGTNCGSDGSKMVKQTAHDCCTRVRMNLFLIGTNLSKV